MEGLAVKSRVRFVCNEQGKMRSQGLIYDVDGKCARIFADNLCRLESSGHCSSDLLMLVRIDGSVEKFEKLVIWFHQLVELEFAII